MSIKDIITDLQIGLNKNGALPKLDEDGKYGSLTDTEFHKQLIVPVTSPILVVSPYHPTFKVPAGCTDLHPYDIARHYEGLKEIVGKVDNALIAHMHEHSGNLGKHSDKNEYSDEVPWCSSLLNWLADLSHCYKSNNALASSWDGYGHPREGDWVEVGDIVRIAHPGGHVTMCAARFNRKTAKTFTGFGGNQGNMLKGSFYNVKDIKSVQVWAPLPGVILAPIGSPSIVGTGTIGESTT